MLSKIGGFINPLSSKSDAVGRADEEKQREKGGGQKKDEAAEEASHDDTFFSLEAIRALLQQEKIDPAHEAMICLDLLQQNGIASIPLRNEQPILDAIIAAAAPLRGK